MQKIKLFKGLESEVEVLESQINRWIENEGVTVLQISANIAEQSYRPDAGGSTLQTAINQPSDILVTLLYETD